MADDYGSMANDSLEYESIPDNLYEGMNTDPVADKGDGGMDHSMHGMDHSMHNMKMHFHGDHSAVIFLFEKLAVESATHIWLYAILTFAMGFAVEFLKKYRLENTTAAFHGTRSNYKQLHLLDTFLHLIQTTIGYLLMLVAMTYHYTLFSAAMVGMASGYCFFNWPAQPSESTDSEKCVSDQSDHALIKKRAHQRGHIVTGDSCGCT